MEETITRVARRAGGLVAAALFLATIAMVYQAYLMWQSPPPALAAGRSPLEVKVSVFLAGLVVAVVGLYLTRNAYRWSAGRNGEE